MFSKIISLIMSFFMVIGSFFGIGGHKEEAQDIIRYSADKKQVTVVLTENPSTGYAWTYKIANDGIMSITDDKFIEPSYTGEIAPVGAAGTREITFEADRTGTTKVVFTYERSWEKVPAEVVTVTFTVAADKTITAEVV